MKAEKILDIQSDTVKDTTWFQAVLQGHSNIDSRIIAQKQTGARTPHSSNQIVLFCCSFWDRISL